MDKKRKLTLIEKTDEIVENATEQEQKTASEHQSVQKGQTNPIAVPILKNMAKFHNEKIGEKLGVKDLLR